MNETQNLSIPHSSQTESNETTPNKTIFQHWNDQTRRCKVTQVILTITGIVGATFTILEFLKTNNNNATTQNNILVIPQNNNNNDTTTTTTTNTADSYPTTPTTREIKCSSMISNVSTIDADFYNEPSCGDVLVSDTAQSRRGIWFSFILSSSSSSTCVTLSTCVDEHGKIDTDSVFDSRIRVYSGNFFADRKCVAGGDDIINSGQTKGVCASVTFEAMHGTNYYSLIDNGQGGRDGVFSLKMDCSSITSGGELREECRQIIESTTVTSPPSSNLTPKPKTKMSTPRPTPKPTYKPTFKSEPTFKPVSRWRMVGDDIDGDAEGDYSGRSVALSSDGSIVAIGADRNDGGGDDAGHVRVYSFENDSWSQLGDDIHGEASDDRSGGSVALSSDGSILAIGAHGNDGGGDGSGHVRIYSFENGSWSQLGEDIDGEAEGDYSGRSVALSSDGLIVAIGADRNDGGGDDAGHVRVYSFENGSWSQLGDDIHGEATNDWSGDSVALSNDGSILAIGAPLNDGGGIWSGHVRVYEFENGSWSQLGDDIDGEAAYDFSGGSVALSSDGSIIAVGANYNVRGWSSSGHVRIYLFENGSWSQLGDDINGEASGDVSGWSVALSSDGSIVAIGAPGNDGGGDEAGHVRIYLFENGSWSQLGDDIDGETADDYSGNSLALSSDGSIVAIGASNNDGEGYSSGHVRVYSLL